MPKPDSTSVRTSARIASRSPATSAAAPSSSARLVVGEQRERRLAIRAVRAAGARAASRPAPSGGTRCRRARRGSAAAARRRAPRDRRTPPTGVARGSERLTPSLGDRRAQRRVAVHRRRGREHELRAAAAARDHLAEVVDRARADGDDRVDTGRERARPVARSSRRRRAARVEHDRLHAEAPASARSTRSPSTALGVGVGDHREAAAEAERGDQLGLAAVERVLDHDRARLGAQAARRSRDRGTPGEQQLRCGSAAGIEDGSRAATAASPRPRRERAVERGGTDGERIGAGRGERADLRRRRDAAGDQQHARRSPRRAARTSSIGSASVARYASRSTPAQPPCREAPRSPPRCPPASRRASSDDRTAGRETAGTASSLPFEDLSTTSAPACRRAGDRRRCRARRVADCRHASGDVLTTSR